MNAMTDDAMALTVAEATMQEWLAAMEVIRTCPPPAWTPALARSPAALSHPTLAQFAVPPTRRTVRRPAAQAESHRRHEEESGAGGARTIYWLALAAALAAMLMI